MTSTFHVVLKPHLGEPATRYMICVIVGLVRNGYKWKGGSFMADNPAQVKTPRRADEGFALTQKEMMVVIKLRQAKRLAELGHRSRMEILFYDEGKSCDIVIEDRERVVEKLVDKAGM